jgi:hypothetical protein
MPNMTHEPQKVIHNKVQILQGQKLMKDYKESLEIIYF